MYVCLLLILSNKLDLNQETRFTIQVIVTICFKSFRLIQSLTRSCDILQYITRFHKTNNILWNLSGITLGFHEVLKYFVVFQFHLWYFWKMTRKFQFHSCRFKIFKFQTWWCRKFKKSISQLPIINVTICTLPLLLNKVTPIMV